MREEIEGVCRELCELLQAKNSDYGGSVHMTYQYFGMTSYLCRMLDKLNRLATISKTGARLVGSESARDTLMDLAGYALLAVTELDREEAQP